MTDQPRTCWRSECRERCAYHGACQPLPRADQSSTPAPSGDGALTDDEWSAICRAAGVEHTEDACDALKVTVERILAARAAQPGTPTAVEALADWYDAQMNWRPWGVGAAIRAAVAQDRAALAQVEAQPSEEGT
jgi:hypothetical protein